MSETTARIRWEELLGGNFEGYAGSVTAPMFEVHRTSGRGATQPWALRSDLLEGYSTGTHPDGLKAEAERWLAGFVSSLGATFPDASDRPSRAWHADWAKVDRDQGGNAILRHKPTGGMYKILPVEEC